MVKRARYPETMGTAEVAQCLSFLANQRNAAINTQQVALNALAYRYLKHLHHDAWVFSFVACAACSFGG